MSDKIIQLIVLLALIVGGVAISAWGFRELSDFFNNLLYWMRYNVGQVAWVSIHRSTWVSRIKEIVHDPNN